MALNYIHYNPVKQSHGESGKIQITRATYELVKGQFECEYIGEITLKGKGRMEAWHLLARKEKRSRYHAGDHHREEDEVKVGFESSGD